MNGGQLGPRSTTSHGKHDRGKVRTFQNVVCSRLLHEVWAAAAESFGAESRPGRCHSDVLISSATGRRGLGLLLSERYGAAQELDYLGIDRRHQLRARTAVVVYADGLLGHLTSHQPIPARGVLVSPARALLANILRDIDQLMEGAPALLNLTREALAFAALVQLGEFARALGPLAADVVVGLDLEDSEAGKTSQYLQFSGMPDPGEKDAAMWEGFGGAKTLYLADATQSNPGQVPGVFVLGTNLVAEVLKLGSRPKRYASLASVVAQDPA